MKLTDILNDFNPLMEGDKKKPKHQKSPISQEVKSKPIIKFTTSHKFDSNYPKILEKYPTEKEKQDVIYTIAYVQRYLVEHGDGNGLPYTIPLPSGGAQTLDYHEWTPRGHGKYDFHIPGADVVTIQIQQNIRVKPPVRYITFLDIGNHSNTRATS
jgi:hypothetical protein